MSNTTTAAAMTTTLSLVDLIEQENKRVLLLTDEEILKDGEDEWHCRRCGYCEGDCLCEEND